MGKFDMAIMIPTSLASQLDTTAGERKLFDIFERTLPNSCVVRYEVLLGVRYRRPDFMLLDPTRGILIVEVKDWGVDTIVRASLEEFQIRYNRRHPPSPQTNPDRKCQIYQRHASEQLFAKPSLRNQSGHLIVTVEYYVAFPNIEQSEFTENGLNRLIPPERVLFKEDLVHSGVPFYQRYDELLPVLNPALNDEQLKAIIAALLPDISIPHVTVPGFVKTEPRIVETDQETLKTYNLSQEQELIAKSIGEGPRLLRGIAGTGKTLIMLYRAKMLAANKQDMKILILCWNVSLANYMRQVYERLQIEVEGKATILHFTAFIRRFLDTNAIDEPEFVQQLEQVSIRETDQYDAIYVDEAQDFRKEWIGFLFHRLLKGEEPASKNLLVAADDAQRIYPTRDFEWSDLFATRLYEGGEINWSQLGIPIEERTILKTIYRNSARVWIFAAFLLEERAAYVGESAGAVRFSAKGGYDPQLIECSSLKAQIEHTIEKIVEPTIQSGHAASNILILYRHKAIGNFHLMDYLLKRLEQANVPHDWIAEDNEAKETFEWEEDTVKISTVHSAKGMDSPIVIVLGAETFRPDQFDGEDEIKLMYVALTRAREVLFVLHTGDGGLVPRLRACQKQYEQYRDSIISRFETGHATDG
jgi:hypothetical protein